MAAGKSSGTFTALAVVGMLLTGTLNTIMTKIQFTMKSVGLDGEEEPFSKPWFATFNMMAAMFVVGILDKCCRSCRGGEEPEKDKETALIPRRQETPYSKKAMLVSVPAAFDIVATALSALGMMYIPASMWQMLRGSSIVFAAIFSVGFLKRKMYCFNLLGLLFCVVGVSIVGLANVLGASGDEGSGQDPGGMMIGIAFVIASQVVQAAQIIAEEFLMKSVDLPPLQIIGWEGFWGTIMMVVLVFPVLMVLPGNDRGHMEDPFDTIEMIRNNQTLATAIGVFFFSCASFNATGILVTSALSGVHRMMLDASRTLMIWAFGLWVHYNVDRNSPFGEKLTDYSALQLIGFTILVFGQAVYGEVIKLPGLHYPAKRMPQPTPTASVRMAQPLPADA